MTANQPQLGLNEKKKPIENAVLSDKHIYGGVGRRYPNAVAIMNG